MPTRMGGYLNGLIFLMFLLSSGYGNNLLLIFTIFLFALNILWLIQTHFHLHRLRLESVRVMNGHVGEPITVTVKWSAAPKGPWQWKATIETQAHSYPLKEIHSEEFRFESTYQAEKRDLYHWKYLRVDTERPFGLYRAWIFYRIDLNSFAYPKLLNSTNLNLDGRDSDGEASHDQKGHEGFRGMAAYQEGESRRISWKHFARSGELLIKEGEELRAPALEIVLNPPQNPDHKEHYLSDLATQMVECHRRQIPFSLRSPGVNLSVGHHQTHLHDCLKVLARC